jgi:hypothetical protein
MMMVGWSVEQLELLLEGALELALVDLWEDPQVSSSQLLEPWSQSEPQPQQEAE